MNNFLFISLIIFVLSYNINIINAQENVDTSIFEQKDEGKQFDYKTKNKSLWDKVKDFLTSKTGLIIIISVVAVIALILITSIIYTVKKVKKEKEENPYVEASKQEFYENENSKSYLNDEPSIYHVPTKDIRNEDGNRFNIGSPNILNGNDINRNNLRFSNSVPQAHTKNSSPINNIRTNDDYDYNNALMSKYNNKNDRNNNTINSSFSSNNRNGRNNVDSNYGSNDRNNISMNMNSNYGSNGRNNNPMNMSSNYGSNGRNNNPMNMSSNYGSNGRNNNPMNMSSNYGSNGRNNNPMNMNSNYGSNGRNNNPMNMSSNYGSNGRNNNPMNMNSNYGSNGRNNNPMNMNSNNNMNSNYNFSNNRNNDPLSPNNMNNINDFNQENVNMNIDNRGSYEAEEEEDINSGNMSFEKLIKDKPQPINVFDRESNPNRTSSLLGEDDIDRLNGYIKNDNMKNLKVENENDNFIPSYYGNNNIEEEDNFENDIPFEFRNLQTFRVIHNFVPHRFDELKVEKGNLLKIIKSFEDGWALCYNINTKNKGFIPKNKLRIVDESINNETNDHLKNFERSNKNINKSSNPVNNSNNNNINSNTISNNSNNDSNNNNINKINIDNKANQFNLDIDQNNKNEAIDKDDDVKVIPNFPKGQLILKFNGKENNKNIGHQIIIEDNMLSHNNSCHVVLDYADTSISTNNTPNLRSPGGSNIDSSFEHLSPNDNIKKNFRPTKSKLSIDFEDISIDNDNDNNNESNDISMSLADNSMLSQPSVQNLSLGRQLMTSQNLKNPSMKHQRRRSSSQPIISEDEKYTKEPMNKNNQKLKSQGGDEFNSFDENRHDNELISESFDSLGIDTSAYVNNNIDGYNENKSNYSNINKEQFDEDSGYRKDNENNYAIPMNNYNYLSEPRRRSRAIKEDYPVLPDYPNYKTEPRSRNKDNEYNYDRNPRVDPRDDPRDELQYERERRYNYREHDGPRFGPRDYQRNEPRDYQRNDPRGYHRDDLRDDPRYDPRYERERNFDSRDRENPRDGPRINIKSPSSASSNYNNERNNQRNEPTENTSFRSNPRTPTGNTSFRSNPRTPRSPTGNTSFRSNPRTPRSPTGNTSFRSNPRTPTGNTSFRNDPRSPNSTNFRNERNPNINYMGDTKLQDDKRDEFRSPNPNINYRNEQEKPQGYINQY